MTFRSFCCFVAVAAFGFVAGTICYEEYGKKVVSANKLKQQCEAELPRNKSCYMQFVSEN